MSKPRLARRMLHYAIVAVQWSILAFWIAFNYLVIALVVYGLFILAKGG